MACATSSENGHALSVTESAKLENLELVIDGGLKSFIEVGRSLMEIREGKLYRVTHMTFEDYCQERWDMSRSYAHRVVEAAATVDLLPTGNIPEHERQIRPLTRLPEGERASAWKEAVESAPDGKPTSAIVEQVVASRMPDEPEEPKEPKKQSREEAKERVEREAAEFLVEFQENVRKVTDGSVYTIETLSKLTGHTSSAVTGFIRMCDVSPFVKVHRNMGRRGLVQYTFEKVNVVTAHERVRKLAQKIADDDSAGRKAQASAKEILSILGG